MGPHPIVLPESPQNGNGATPQRLCRLLLTLGPPYEGQWRWDDDMTICDPCVDPIPTHYQRPDYCDLPPEPPPQPIPPSGVGAPSVSVTPANPVTTTAIAPQRSFLTELKEFFENLDPKVWMIFGLAMVLLVIGRKKK